MGVNDRVADLPCQCRTFTLSVTSTLHEFPVFPTTPTNPPSAAGIAAGDASDKAVGGSVPWTGVAPKAWLADLRAVSDCRDDYVSMGV